MKVSRPRKKLTMPMPNIETPQRCPRCGSPEKGMTRDPFVRDMTTYVPFGPYIKCSDPFHTAPVPAPFPSGNNLAIGEGSEANITEREVAPEPSREWICEDELPEGYPYDEMFPLSKLGADGLGGVRIFPKLELAAAPTGTPACPKCGPNAVCDHQGWVYNPDERLKEMREKKTAPTGTGERSKHLPNAPVCPTCPLGVGHNSDNRHLSASRVWLDKFGDTARGNVSWSFACSFAEDFAEQENAALRSQLAEAQKYNAHFCAATGPMDEFDTYEDAIQRIKDVRSQPEGAKHAFQQAHMWKMENAKRADKAERDLATAQARIARYEEALQKLAKGNRSPGVLEIARTALAEPQSGEK